MHKKTDSKILSRDSYVLRIYRRDREAPEKIAGTIEIVEGGGKISFTNFDELKNILTQKGHPDSFKG
ncbi:MAG: hypothetical protein EPN94_03660 [Nitrospirae bacterium]|nr:MAG: hypothetical protein EPN94_03660 [Nitrospirota bacterium]